MTDRKYLYVRPRNSEEHLEALYEELSLSPKGSPHLRPEQTVKDYLAALLDHLRRADRRRTSEKENEVGTVSWALGALAVLAIIFLFNGFGKPGDWAWLDEHRFAVRLWGTAFAAVFVGVSIENTSLFRTLWSFGVTKLVTSLAVSALVVFSTGKAAGLLNAVFPVDAAALPLTRAIVAGILAFKYSYPLLIVVALFAVFHGMNTATWIRMKWTGKGEYEAPPLLSMAFLVLSLVVLLFFARWVNRDFSDEMLPAKVYRLAHLLDFNLKYECSNLREGLSVVFLGPDQARVLVDVGSAQTDDMESFIDARKSGQVTVPQRFYVLPCEVDLPKGER